MHLPDPIIAICIHFQPLFTAPTYRKMLLLVCGTLLAKDRRTATAALKFLGLDQDHNWPSFTTSFISSSEISLRNNL